MFKAFFITILFLTTTVVRALEIDEKLTLRFLKVSATKKTVLINRGAEDGLVVGNHAKFFITSGVIARGVVEKVSPSRSIWSLYRVVDPEEITDGKVLNLKIATPVKITDDPSKSLKEEPIPAGTEKMDINEKASETEEVSSASSDDSEKKELEGLGIEVDKTSTHSPAKKTKRRATESASITVEDIPVVSDKEVKNWEVWGSLHLNALAGTVTDSSTTTQNTSAASSDIAGAVGIERYFLSASSDFWKNLSLQGFVRNRIIKYETASSTTLSRKYFDYGGGVSYHFLNPMTSVNKFILLGNISAGLGSITQTNEDNTTGNTTEWSGTENFVSLGVGSKYYLSNGWGARALLSYYQTKESYTVPSTDPTQDRTVTRDLTGAKLELGISYRF